MLCLNRKVGESIFIYDENKPDVIIEVINLKIRGNQQTVGVNAPSNIKVYRKEIWERIQKEKEETAE